MKGSISKNNFITRGILNKIFLFSVGGEKRPPLLHASEIFPESKVIEDNFESISLEIKNLVNSRSLTEYKDIDPIRALEVSENWKLYYAWFMWKENDRAKLDCPNLIKVIEKLPNVLNATIAVLDPGVKLSAHKGPYAGLLRYHLGIKIPVNNPPYIRVKDQLYTWKVGESIVIDDCYDHEVYNDSDDIRVILMVDFLRPLPTPLNLINKFYFERKKKWSGVLINKSNST